MQILIVLTSIDRVPGTDHMTGTWLEELAAPYFVFLHAGAKVTLASVNGGAAPLDPLSQSAAAQTAATQRFRADPVARQAQSARVAHEKASACGAPQIEPQQATACCNTR